MERTSEEIEQRLKGIIASAEIEDMPSSEKDVEMLRRLANGEISEAEYKKYYGIG